MESMMLYNPAHDASLIKDSMYAKKICFRYNALSPENQDEKFSLLKILLGKIGNNVTINQSFHCDMGYNITLGDNFFSNYNLIILDCAKVTFGDNVLVGPNCGFYTPEHPFNIPQRIQGLEYARPITVGNNVWIGGSVTVLSGVTIAENAVIGAGSVVTKNIPANVAAAGNPCRILREIPPEELFGR